MNAFVLSGLVKRRAQLAGDIENTHEVLRKMVLDLESLDATIVQFCDLGVRVPLRGRPKILPSQIPNPLTLSWDSGGGGEERGGRGQVTVSPMWKVSGFYLDIARVYVTDNSLERFDHFSG